ncbi:YceH family protein [Mesorhizobium sp. ESP6-5]|nr:YceH family protein [Mesorhizobium sp. ESP6-5]MBZ9757647.1 YceH family protein [Mesorhizobium sp. ESP6-5]
MFNDGHAAANQKPAREPVMALSTLHKPAG